MARKLSHIAHCATPLVVALIVSLTYVGVRAEGEFEQTSTTNEVANPFSVHTESLAAPQGATAEPQMVHRPPITYQNPFAAMSKSPPSDASLRPGPITRWQRPTIKHEEPSPIKSAVLSAQSGDSPPPGITPIAARCVRFPPKPLAQPPVADLRSSCVPPDGN